MKYAARRRGGGVCRVAGVRCFAGRVACYSGALSVRREPIERINLAARRRIGDNSKVVQQEVDMARQIHLNKSGSGFASKTACGRNLLRTPMSTDWAGFRAEGQQCRCVKCDESKFAEFHRKQDAKQEGRDDWKPDLDAWVPVDDPDAWKKADDALFAGRRAA